jgi:hypothetical protein
MKTKVLQKLTGSYYLLLCICFTLISNFASGQSESNDMITYDTLVPYTGIPTVKWMLRITRPRVDTASRPVIISMPGAGEVGTDTTYLTRYGPHYWLQHGWDGGVQLGNGKHYPILITICQGATNTRPWYLQALMDTILSKYHIKRNSVHVAGLSMGGWTWGRFISYAAFTGDEHCMSLVKSYTALEGVANDNFSGFDMPGWTMFGHWAAKYGGRFFGLEGDHDNRGEWNVSENMNDSVPSTAFFSYEDIGGGVHCCWNSMYDPSVTNWTSSNPNITSNALHPNTLGTYFAPSNIFQWMLRQGDTTLVITNIPNVNAGANQTITLPTNSVTLTGAASGNGGATISSTTWSQSSGPGTATISSASNLSTAVTGLVAGTYIFKLSVTDNHGLANSANVTITVNPANVPPTVNAGAAQTITLPTNSANLTGTATGNGGATISTTTWTQSSGPSTATIVSASNLSTVVNGLVTGTYIFKLTATDNHGLSASATITITVNPANIPPTVNAGTAQTITLPANSVILTGTATGNGGATISTTAWTQTSGPNSAIIVSASNLSTTVNGLVAGTYIFTLTVTDNHGLSGSATVTITVNPANVPPTVNAGAPQTITLPSSSVTLTGAAVGNGGATISSTTWSQASGPNTASISTASSLSTTVTGLAAGSYVFTLTATDNNGLTGTASVTIVVNPPNTPPSVSAGGPQTITLPTSSVTLTGTANGNGGATISTTVWSQASGPNTAGISTSSNLSTAVTGLIQGVYIFQLAATDNNGLSNTSTVTITVNPANIPPTVSAGSGQTITLPTNSITLIGAATGNGVASISSTSWSQTSGPNTAGISTASALSTDITGLIQGVYIFQLAATDNNGLSSTSSVTITVNPANIPPTVSAGSAQTITLPTNSVALTGMATGNGGATISSVSWTQTAGPAAATINSSSNLLTAVTGLVQGIYTFQLSASDNNGLSNTSTVTVTVNPANIPPTVSAGPNQTITLPLNSVTLTGTASGSGGATISSVSWTEASGPNMAMVNSPGNLSTAVMDLVQGVYTFQLIATDNNGLSSTSTVTVTVNAANIPPTVDAGTSQTISLPTNSVALSGSANGNSGAVIVSVTWTEISGPNTASVANASNLATSATGLIQGVYTFQLAATDNNGLSNTAIVTVTVNPASLIPPTVAAGTAQSITLPLNTVTLNGTANGNGGATISSVSWSQTSGPNTATINSASSLATNITGLIQGIYTFQLAATDNNGLSNTSTVTVTVNPANIPPTVSTGPNQAITLPANSVTLAGTATGNGGASIVSVSWTQDSGPTTANINSPSSPSTTVNSLITGTYTFTLIATDNNGLSNSATVTIIVNPANIPPTVNAGSTQTLTLPLDSATLTGMATGNGGATISSTLWSQTSGPNVAVITDPTNVSTSISGLAQGTYTFQLAATDNNGLSASATVTIVVGALVNQPPIANAGFDQTITLPVNSISLDGTRSFDPDGSIVAFNWNKTAGPGAITITNANTSTPSIYGLQAGQYIFELTVTDNSGATGNDQVTITVNPDTTTAAPVPIVANAGNDTTITMPADTAILNALRSTGNISDYQWLQVSGPNAAAIVSSSAPVSMVENLIAGEYIFRLTVTDNLNNKDTAIVKVTVVNGLRSQHGRALIFPNPAHDIVQVSIIDDLTGKTGITVYDLNGKVVIAEQFDKPQSSVQKALNVSALAKGAYFVLINIDNKKTIVAKLIKD